MQGDINPHGYDLLAHLRRLETRIAHLQERWQTFRADPRPEQLDDFRVAFAGTDRALRELAERLGAGPRPATADAPGAARPSTAGGPSSRPDASAARDRRSMAEVFGTDARAIVEAGRTLDQALGEIARAWGFLRREPDPDGLSGLADRLARAEAAASLLGRALPRDDAEETGDAGGASDAGDAGPADAAEAGGTAAAGGAAGPAGLPRIDAERASSLDGLLSRIRDDWQHMRREPAADRAGVLRGELEEARRMAEALRNQLVAAPPDPSAARHMTGMDDPVRFAPYRDSFTGLYNREGFDALAGAELKRCRRYDRSFGLLLVETRPADLAELRATVGHLQSLIRGYDLVSRYSDRQIAVGLPEADGPETRRVAARLLRAVEESGEGRTPVRRLAYALMPDDGATLAALVEAAGERLDA